VHHPPTKNRATPPEMHEDRRVRGFEWATRRRVQAGCRCTGARPPGHRRRRPRQPRQPVRRAPSRRPASPTGSTARARSTATRSRASSASATRRPARRRARSPTCRPYASTRHRRRRVAVRLPDLRDARALLRRPDRRRQRDVQHQRGQRGRRRGSGRDAKLARVLPLTDDLEPARRLRSMAQSRLIPVWRSQPAARDRPRHGHIEPGDDDPDRQQWRHRPPARGPEPRADRPGPWPNVPDSASKVVRLQLGDRRHRAKRADPERERAGAGARRDARGDRQRRRDAEPHRELLRERSRTPLRHQPDTAQALGCVAGTFVSLAGGRLTTLGANGRFAAMISEALDGLRPADRGVAADASVNADGIGGLAYDGSRVAYPLFRCDRVSAASRSTPSSTAPRRRRRRQTAG